MNSNKYETLYHWYSDNGDTQVADWRCSLILQKSDHVIHAYSFLIKNPSVDSKKSSHYKDSIVSPYHTCHILIVAVKSLSPACPIPPLFPHNFYILLKINLFSCWMYSKYLSLDDRQPTTISYFPIYWISDHFLFNLYSLWKWSNSFEKIINSQFSTYTTGMQNFRI